MTHHIHHMLESFFAAFAFEIKLTLASIIAGSAFIADISSDVKGYEELGLKAVLAGAVVWIGRLYLSQQQEHKKEMKDTWDLHKKELQDRDTKATEARESNTKALVELTSLTREQTDYFKTVTRNIVEERIKKPSIP